MFLNLDYPFSLLSQFLNVTLKKRHDSSSESPRSRGQCHCYWLIRYWIHPAVLWAMHWHSSSWYSHHGWAYSHNTRKCEFDHKYRASSMLLILGKYIICISTCISIQSLHHSFKHATHYWGTTKALRCFFQRVSAERREKARLFHIAWRCPKTNSPANGWGKHNIDIILERSIVDREQAPAGSR